jgi:hypothetical protein
VTLAEFSLLFGKLANQLGKEADEQAVRDYFDALSDLDYSVVFDAAAQLAKSSKWFPKTSEWRDVAFQFEREKRLHDLTGGRDWKIECEHCDDTGWEYFACDGDETCGRSNPHLPHNYVRICPCRPTNRTFQRHHQQAS